MHKNNLNEDDRFGTTKGVKSSVKKEVKYSRITEN